MKNKLKNIGTCKTWGKDWWVDLLPSRFLR